MSENRGPDLVDRVPCIQERLAAQLQEPERRYRNALGDTAEPIVHSGRYGQRRFVSAAVVRGCGATGFRSTLLNGGPPLSVLDQPVPPS